MLNLQIKLLRTIVIFTGVILLLFSCDNRPKGVLSLNKMTSVITEMHKTDAVLTERGINYGQYTSKAPYYKFIFKKYKITQAQFDSSLVWYTKNPRIFNNMYDNVLVNLNTLQKEVKNGKYHTVDTLDLYKMRTYIWNKNPRYILTHDSTRTHLDFVIKDNNFLYGDVYILKFLQRIAPEDSCINPRIVFRINYTNGKTDSISQTAFNDSLLRRYTFRFRAMRKQKIESLTGELLASKTYKGKQNAKTDSITMYREYNSKIQDSLRRVVDPTIPGAILRPQNMNFEPPRINKKFINRRFNHPGQ